MRENYSSGFKLNNNLDGYILYSQPSRSAAGGVAIYTRHRGGSRGRVQGVRTPPPRDNLRFSNTTAILQKKKTMWFIGVEVEQETSAPPPKKNPGSAPETYSKCC